MVHSNEVTVIHRVRVAAAGSVFTLLPVTSSALWESGEKMSETGTRGFADATLRLHSGHCSACRTAPSTPAFARQAQTRRLCSPPLVPGPHRSRRTVSACRTAVQRLRLSFSVLHIRTRRPWRLKATAGIVEKAECVTLSVYSDVANVCERNTRPANLGIRWMA